MRLLAPFLVCVSLTADVAAQSPRICGTITVEQACDAPLLVWVMRLQTLEGGQIIRASKREIFEASVAPGKTLAADNGKYVVPVEAGHHSLFAFADLDEDGRWDPQIPEPFGWYATQPGGRFDVIEVGDEPRTGVDFTLRAPRPFPSETQRTSGGALCKIKGYTVLQLRGDARARGFAHGRLLASQILDFFQFYILEDKFRSARAYRDGFAKFLESHFTYPQPFVAECTAVLEGMRASGQDLFSPMLGREFSLVDLYAINGYIETRAMRSSCTQFAAWGPRTEGTDVDGGMITGRNMDGEIDIRKVTVSHFLILAVDPSESGQKRYVSMMWPGFVATISGINEDGFYAMENAGVTGPGKVVDQLAPFAWTMRETLARLGSDATPTSVQAFVDAYENAAGGVCGPGCVTLFAMPYRRQRDPAFVLEGDRFGEMVRLAGTVRPRTPGVIVLSNHHQQYGVDAKRPGTNFGKEPSFSSRWRYEAGMHKLEAWDRTGRQVGTQEMRELLQTVAHGTTEYAIITRPNQLEFDVAVASMKPELWDAPYREWTTFKFDDVFPDAKALSK